MGLVTEKGICPPIGEATGSKAQNAEWFATDLVQTVQGASAFRIQLITTAGVVVEITLDSGTSWYKLNSGNALTANCVYIFTVATRLADAFNMRTPTVG